MKKNVCFLIVTCLAMAVAAVVTLGMEGCTSASTEVPVERSVDCDDGNAHCAKPSNILKY